MNSGTEFYRFFILFNIGGLIFIGTGMFIRTTYTTLGIIFALLGIYLLIMYFLGRFESMIKEDDKREEVKDVERQLKRLQKINLKGKTQAEITKAIEDEAAIRIRLDKLNKELNEAKHKENRDWS